MKSLIVKRSVVFNGHKTSVSLEDAFWNSLKEIANTHGVTAVEVGRGDRQSAPAQQPFFSGPFVRIGPLPHF